MNDPGKAVFLSYASQDAEAAKKIADALRAAGVEVWFDQSELVGGDAWDAKIRKQIASCALFVPIISTNTQARAEGYFRLEWKLADRRTDLIGKSKAFLLPVCIDSTKDADADVPDSFLTVQWTKLSGGETTPAFVSRVQKLLGSSSVGGALRPDTTASSAHKTSSAKARPRWRIPVVIVALLIAGALGQRYMQRDHDAAVPLPAAPVSEARKLVAQARALFEGDELLREDFNLAEELLTKAQVLDATDGEVWAARAQLSHDVVFVGLDPSRARMDDLRIQAERAKALAPDSIETQLAYAGYLQLVGRKSPASAAEAARLLQPLVARAPSRRRVYRMLGSSLMALGKLQEGGALLDRANALPGGDPFALLTKAIALFLYGRYDEAETALAQSLALRPTGRACVMDTLMKLTWRGDLDGAVASLTRWPAQMALEPRGAFVASQVWYWHHQPDKAIESLQAYTSESINDLFFTGPKSGLLALAYEVAGRPDAARIAWGDTKNTATRLLTEDPTQSSQLAWKGVALARLGETTEAESLLRQSEQTAGLRSDFWSCGATSALLRLAVNRGDEIAAKFDAEQRTDPGKVINVPSPQAALRLNPVFDPIRATPEFQQWLAAAPAPKPKLAGVTSPASDEKSIAVLAFANRSADQSNEYFSDGISEELLNVLGRVPGLTVAARASSFHFKGQSATVQEIGRQLHVAHVVDGSVQKVGDLVRISASLNRADTGELTWSETYTKKLTDVFALEDEIARDIAEKLQLALGASPAVAHRRVNPEAHQLLLEGMSLRAQRTYESLAGAEAVISRALRLDPEFAAAHAELAQVYSVRGIFRMSDGYDDPWNDNERAVAEAQQALALDPTQAEAYASLGFTYVGERRWEEAEQMLQKAIKVNPSSSTAHLQNWALQQVRGRLDMALQEADRAVELDPLSFTGHALRANTLLALRRFDEALAASDLAESLRPETTSQGLASRVQVLWELGRHDDAVKLARKILAKPTMDLRFEADGVAIWTLRRAGLHDEAAARAETLFKLWPAQSYLRGAVLVALGRFAEALPFLEKTAPLSVHRLYWNELFDPYRSDPGFAQLIGKLGCAEEYRTARATLVRLQAEARK